MRNENLPLIRALRNRKVKEPDVPMLPQTDRLFELKKEDIKPASRQQPGDPIRVSLQGRVKSMHDDGSMQMYVHQVEHQSDETDLQEAPKLNVQTQESHAP